ncbi:MAG: DUF4266 domain-containing protein [Sulfurimonadaceae bacterium]|jgi:PBP1b-binding outer membrane lipoprotein LpoB
MRYITVLAAALLFSGCVSEVQPWEKATLAKESMKEGGANNLVKKYEEHIYYSKEATKGGGSIGAGGCGCN